MRAKYLCPIAFSFIAILFCTSSHAQDANSAKLFLTEAYSHYGKNDKGAVGSRYIHSSLLALMKTDEQAVGTDVPISGDGDLFCDCQEWFGIYDLKIEVKMDGLDRADAEVSFVLSNTKDQKERDFYSRSLLFTLVPEHGKWRVYNVISYRKGEPPSDLRKDIEKEIQEYAQESKGKSTH
jgi:hypothetical protein